MPVWTHIPTGGFSQFGNQWRTHSSRFPRWGLPVLLIAALPGLAIALLSIVLLMASLLALLLLMVPVFKVVTWLAGFGGGGGVGEGRSRRSSSASAAEVELEARLPSPGSKPVEVRVVDS